MVLEISKAGSGVQNLSQVVDFDNMLFKIYFIFFGRRESVGQLMMMQIAISDKQGN